jgi:hypothetical protein
MNSGIKIIKRSHTGELQNAPLRQDENPGRRSEREIAGTVKNWIGEWAQQRRADEHIARTRFFAAAHS